MIRIQFTEELVLKGEAAVELVIKDLQVLMEVQSVQQEVLVCKGIKDFRELKDFKVL
jgi:hypothetical protein